MAKAKITNIVFYGIGGQGIVTMAEVCGWAAMLAGFHVKKTEVHGMAQRGGSVESYIRFGKKVFSPLPQTATADYLICLHPEEHPRLLGELKKGGVDLFPYLEVAQKVVGDKKVFVNSFLLGVLSSYLGLEQSYWMQAMEKIFKRSLDENKAFFQQGYQAGGSL
ncbi:MAG TPA: 2-oxoacid:acceptor oxidoreductase family protein [Candidatus Omnitrophota bacterium]|nr:2-oxoacid:acceptor oxidoreductase family protein [Candidatus Omnitrophota bacterium]HQL41835.1 2-oxoacid:acceptor oxidoreductase family protein [Candidatus Omnitrophota bacterium]